MTREDGTARRALLVGAGNMGRAWARNLRATPGVELAGWVDVSAEALAHAVAEAGMDGLTTDTDLGRALAAIDSPTLAIYGEHRFELADWSTLTTGSPVLLPCLATFDCRLVEAVPAATHSIFIGRVEAVAFELDLQPLVYAGGDYGLIASLLDTAEG